MSVPIAGHGAMGSTIPAGNMRLTNKAWAPVPMASDYWFIPGGSVANGDFETNTAGWAIMGGAVLVRDTVDMVSGLASGKVTVNALNDGVGYALQLTAGRSYTFSAWVKAPVGKLVRLRFLDAAGTPSNAFVAATGTGAWALFSVTYVSGGGAVTVQVYDATASAYPYNFNLDGVRVVGN